MRQDGFAIYAPSATAVSDGIAQFWRGVIPLLLVADGCRTEAGDGRPLIVRLRLAGRKS